MKKTFLVLSLMLGLAVCATAQEGSGLFHRGAADETEQSKGLRGGGFPGLPDHGGNGDSDAPLTGGALLLVGFGAAYALSKKNKD